MVLDKVLAIIPARGGSKGIYKKNIISIGGVPLIARTIKAAKESKIIDRIIVSTDDKNISEISEQYGAETLSRPMDISGDKASSESALLHVLDKLKNETKYEPNITVFMQCTSPFIEAEDIDGTILSIKNGFDSAFSATTFHHFLWEINSEGCASGINHQGGLRQRRQDINVKQYLETGAIYAFKTSKFLTEKTRFCGKVAIWDQINKLNIEIDTPIDFEIAKAIQATKKSSDLKKLLPKKIQAIVFDFDGVFTDDTVITNSEGIEGIKCSRSDGMGIGLLHQLGIKMLVLSKEKNQVVRKRCQKLKLECFQGVDNKISYLSKWLKNQGINPINVIYIGNDINDIDCLKYVGCPSAPNNHHPDISQYIKLRLTKNGGEGAVRELCDLVANSFNNKEDF